MNHSAQARHRIRLLVGAAALLASGACTLAGPDPAHQLRLSELHRQTTHQRDALLVVALADRHETGDYDALVQLLEDELAARPSGPLHQRYRRELGIVHCERAHQRELLAAPSEPRHVAVRADYARCLELLEAAPLWPSWDGPVFHARATSRLAHYR